MSKLDSRFTSIASKVAHADLVAAVVILFHAHGHGKRRVAERTGAGITRVKST
jgi:hypothetical protein